MDRERWDHRYREAELLWSPTPNGLFVAEVEALPPGRALELGTGEGRNALWLAEQGWAVTGVDFSEVGLEKAKQIAAERGVEVDWVAADLVDYDPGPRAWDLIAVIYLHVAPATRKMILGRAADALAPGGEVVIIGHDVRNLTEGYGGPPDPDILLTPEEVAAELAPLEIIKAEQAERIVATDEGERRAIDTVVRARKTAG